MTRAEAVSTGQNAATRFGRVFVVYRLPGWPPDVYGCRKDDPIDGLNLPKEAALFERLAPGGSAVTHERKRPADVGLPFGEPIDAALIPDLEDDSEIGEI